VKPTPQAIENAARAMRHITFNALTMDECRDAAQAALSADLGDMVLVPREPTPAIIKAYIAADRRRKRYAATAKRDYRAMIAAAEDSNDKG